MDPPDVLDSPRPLPSSPPTSNTQLAALLSEAFREIDALKRDLAIAKKRAERAERLVQTLNSDPSSSPPNQDQQHAQTLKRLIEDYEDRLAQAEMAREDAEARRRVAQESWEQTERYISLVESRAKDARIAFARVSEGSLVPLVLPPLPPHIGAGGGSLSTYPPSSSSQVMAPPTVPSRQHSRKSAVKPFISRPTSLSYSKPQPSVARDREHRASMLIQHCSASSQAIEPTLMSNSGENLGHLTLSRYVFIFLLSMSPIDY
jgi:hypothetical protein